MRKKIKPMNNRWILILLLVFNCSSMMGQDINKVKINWSSMSAIVPPEHNEYEKKRTYEVIIPTNVIGPSGSSGSISDYLRLNVEVLRQPISSTPTNFDTSSFSSTELSNFNFFLTSLFSSFGSSWGIGDIGVFDYEVPTSDSGGGSGGGSTIYDCPNPPVCSAGFKLVNCFCEDKKSDIDRCNQAKKNDARASNLIVMNQNNEIRTQSTIKEFGAEQNLTTFPPSATPTFMNIPVRTDPDPIIPAPTITNQFTTKFTWNATDGYTIGASHGHPKGRAPSFADMVLAYKFLKSSELIAAGQTAIDYFKANFTTTIVTQNEVFMVNVTDWDALGKLSNEFDLNSTAARKKYTDYTQDYINNNFFGEILTAPKIKEATTYAALKIFGHAISMAKLVNGDSKFIPLKLDAEDNIIEITCP